MKVIIAIETLQDAVKSVCAFHGNKLQYSEVVRGCKARREGKVLLCQCCRK